MKNKKLLQLTAILALYISSVFAKDTINIQTFNGEVAVPQNPAKTAVLTVGVLENLHLLGVENIAVPNTTFIPALNKAYENAPKVGGFKPDVEALIKYQPEVIIVGPRASRFMGKLNDIALTINLSIKYDNFLDNAKANMLTLGKIYDKEALAQLIVNRIDAKFNEVKQLTKYKGKALVIMTTGGKMAAFGDKSRFAWVYKEMGFVPAVVMKDDNPHGMPISNEFLKETNPDWLLVFDRDAAIGKAGKSAQELLNNPLVAETNAGKNDQILYLDPANYISIFGLETLERTVDTVIKKLKK